MPGLIAIAAAIFAPVAAATPAGWHADTDKKCTITLPVADPAKDIGLKIDLPAAQDEVFVSLQRSDWAASPLRQTDGVKLSLEPGGVASVADIWFGPDDAEGSVPSLRLGVKGRDFLAKLAAARTLVVTEETRTIARLPLRKPVKAIAALRACREARQRSWGIDPAFWSTLRSEPSLVGNGGYIYSGDYPADALAAHISGEVTVRVDVDAAGMPTGCAVVESSGHDSLDQTTCRLLVARARFHPAVGADGKAVAAPFIMPVRWRLPY